MATVTTTSTDNGSLRSWRVPPDSSESAVPMGEVTYSGNQIVAAKDAANVSMWNLQCNMPRNFVYQLTELVITIRSSLAALSDLEKGIHCQVTTDASGLSAVFSRAFTLGAFSYPAPNVISSANNQASFVMDDAGLVAVAEYKPVALPKNFFDASDAGRFFFSLIDPTSDSTVAWTASWYMRLMQFDVTQLNAFPIHYQHNVIGA